MLKPLITYTRVFVETNKIEPIIKWKERKETDRNCQDFVEYWEILY